MNSILQALIVFSNVLSIYNKATASYQRVFEVLETKPKVEDQGVYETLTPIENMIEFKNVNFGYLQKDVLHDLSFTIKKGETVGIIGGTGAGKSTLVSLIGRNYDTRSGEIWIAGKRIQDYKLAPLRKHISYVLQNTSLISGTIKENIAYGKPEATDEEIIEAAKKARVHKYIMSLPQGYDTVVEEDGGNMSQGQMQLVCIARIMLTHPPMLILSLIHI